MVLTASRGSTFSGLYSLNEMRVGVVEQGCQVFLIEGQRGSFSTYTNV